MATSYGAWVSARRLDYCVSGWLLTIPVEMYHSMIVTGSAKMYGIRLVKLRKRNRLPTYPQMRDVKFVPYTLITSVLRSFSVRQTYSDAHQPGSLISIPSNGARVPPSRSVRQYETRAAMLKTFARGAIVAARSLGQVRCMWDSKVLKLLTGWP